MVFLDLWSNVWQGSTVYNNNNHYNLYASEYCNNGNNGGCENKKCIQGRDSVNCSCDAYPVSEENSLLARGKKVTKFTRIFYKL